MPEYAAGFYRFDRDLDFETTRRCVSVLHQIGMGFFPLRMWVSKTDALTFSSPDQLERDHVPTDYYISPGVARIPLKAANGVAIDFTETADSTLIPGSLTFSFSTETIAQENWHFGDLVCLFRSLAVAFAPNHGVIWDRAHRGRASYTGRAFEYDRLRVPIGLFWFNYFDPQWARNLGRNRLQELSKHVALEDWLPDGGVVIALQEEPYDEGNPVHRERQLFLEEKVLDLPAIHARFPSRGL